MRHWRQMQIALSEVCAQRWMVAEKGYEISRGYFRSGDNKLDYDVDENDSVGSRKFLRQRRDEIIEETKSRTELDRFMFDQRQELRGDDYWCG